MHSPSPHSAAGTSGPLNVAFLGCGFITDVHSRQLRALKGEMIASYASRDAARSADFVRRHRGRTGFTDYAAAIESSDVDAVVIAVPPVYHHDLALQAIAAGKHVLVEKPAFMSMAEFQSVRDAADRAGRIVMVAENDHYKPLAVRLRSLISRDLIGELVFAHFTTITRKFKRADDWRNDVTMAGGGAFYEEGIHWLHVAGSLGPRITSAHGYQPTLGEDGPDRRAKSMLVAFQYDNGAVGSLTYSREIPSLLRGVRMSKLFGRKGVITFESNGGFIVVRGAGLPRIYMPGIRDIRGYQAMYRDFANSIRTGRQPEMSLERAMDDQRLMEQIHRTAQGQWP